MVFVERGRRREADARALAQTNFRMANRAVRDYLTSVSQNTLLKQQDSVDLRDLRRELLTSALDYYKDFVRQRGGDPQLRRELAEAHYRLGEIAGEIGTIGESIAAFEAARSIWRELQANAPDDPAIRAHFAECQLAIGSRLAADDQFKAATVGPRTRPRRPAAADPALSRRRGLPSRPGRVLPLAGAHPVRARLPRSGPRAPRTRHEPAESMAGPRSRRCPITSGSWRISSMSGLRESQAARL